MDNMDDDEQRTMTRFMQMMNDLRSSDRKHIDFGDNLFRLTDVTTTAPPIDLFPERDDSWSIIWYIASFSGLIAFFLIVSCSEWCCRLHVRGPAQPPASTTVRPTSSSHGSQATSFQIQETPPPAYDLFAPPSYESVRRASAVGGANTSQYEKSEFDVYVVPVHAICMLQSEPVVDNTRGHCHTVEDDPPSYISVQMTTNTDSTS